MNPLWTPEHQVDQELAHRLVADQFPDLATKPQHVGAGFEVGDGTLVTEAGRGARWVGATSEP